MLNKTIIIVNPIVAIAANIPFLLSISNFQKRSVNISYNSKASQINRAVIIVRKMVVPIKSHFLYLSSADWRFAMSVIVRLPSVSGSEMNR